MANASGVIVDGYEGLMKEDDCKLQIDHCKLQIESAMFSSNCGPLRASSLTGRFDDRSIPPVDAAVQLPTGSMQYPNLQFALINLQFAISFVAV